MTREEEIRQEIALQLAGCFGNYSEGYEEGFIAGAKWADETMIEKACEWLENNMYYHDCGNYDVITCSSDTIEEMIDNFKKAMEL